MKNQTNIYFFDSISAVESARKYTDRIFFYNGIKVEGAPENSINVPIDNFTNYFLNTQHSYPQELNFDNMNFSDDIINQITQNIIETLSSIKTQKLQELNALLEEEISASNINLIIYTIVEYIKANSSLDTQVPVPVVKKLLQSSNYLMDNNLSLDSDTKIIILELLDMINRHYCELISKDIIVLHLAYSLTLLSSQRSEQNLNEEEYFKALASFDDIEKLIVNFSLVKILYNEEQFTHYIKCFSEALVDDDFWNKETIEQKQIIFKLYYLTHINYAIGGKYKEIFTILNEIFTIAIDKNLDELVFYLYTPLTFSWNAASQTQEEFKFFNDTIERKFEKFISNTLVPKYKIQENIKSIDNNKIKVAFLQDRVVAKQSVHEVFYLFLKSIEKDNLDKYEFIIYNLNFMEFGGSDAKAVNELKELGFNYIDLHEDYIGNKNAFYSIVEKSLKIRARLIEDDIDILVGMNTRPEYNFLFTTRTAPKQVYWSHGNFEYDINKIDIKTSHFPGAIDTDYAYKYFSLPVTIDEYNPKVDEKLVQKTRTDYPKDAYILGSIGRLIKIDNIEYLSTVAAIMKENPFTIYLACGSGEQIEIKNKISTLGISDRFYFTGNIDPHIYGHIIDLLLSPFPFAGGAALQEYIYKEKPFVIRSKYYEMNMNESQNYNILKRLKQQSNDSVLAEIYTQSDVDNLNTKGYLFEQNKACQTYFSLPSVKDSDEYIKVANLFVNNPEISDKVSKETVFVAKNKNKNFSMNFIDVLTT